MVLFIRKYLFSGIANVMKSMAFALDSGTENFREWIFRIGLYSYTEIRKDLRPWRKRRGP